MQLLLEMERIMVMEKIEALRVTASTDDEGFTQDNFITSFRTYIDTRRLLSVMLAFCDYVIKLLTWLGVYIMLGGPFASTGRTT